ncbi:helix-turn-helix transcriptional regulator [Pediococcus acidilactici]|uniref:helix-turn-helix domain-containing protein n=1 Tax=Pediococcus acidilactici TaxID=1254 RepID=UPI00232C868A|nr:helix-turn-helix transcriptional regulator [Pediococcus acidilactici]MDB8867648.1 helix-turn-helix transcriptional regulator [Pediococcus acidilactici]
MTIFDNIKNIAKKRGYSIAEVERRAGISTNYLYQWKKREPSPKSLSAVASVLGVSVDYLLGKTDKEHADEKNDDDIEKAVEKAINSSRMYQGKPISESQKKVMKKLLKAYLESQQE